MHCSEKYIWLLSICLDIRLNNLGIFHFRGYLAGRCIKEIHICAQYTWKKGEAYLIKLKVHKEVHDFILMGDAMEVRKIDLYHHQSWENY